MLTDAQLQAFRTALFAENDPDLVGYRTNGQATMIAQWYRGESSPQFIVWRTSVTQDEIMQNGFDWTRVDNLANGAARVWEWMFNNEARSIDPSKVNVRAGIEAVWKGTAADLAVRAAVYAHCKRPANRLERLFATGTGSDASPGMMVVQGDLSETDVTRALAEV